MKRITNFQGFSLIELMIVLAIMGILTLVVYPSYSSYITKSRRSEAKVALTQLAQFQENFYARENRYANDFRELGIIDSANTARPGFLIEGDGSCEGCVTTPIFSERGSYAIEILPPDSPGGGQRFELRAIPVGNQAAGEEKIGQCYQFRINFSGRKTAFKKGSTENNPDCWR